MRVLIATDAWRPHVCGVVRTLTALAKSAPKAISYGSPGIGNSLHLATEIFAIAAGIEMLHVPYKGAAQAIPDLLSGQIQLMFVSIPDALPHIKSGKLRAIAITSAARTIISPAAPSAGSRLTAPNCVSAPIFS